MRAAGLAARAREISPVTNTHALQAAAHCVTVPLGDRSYDIRIKPGILGEIGSCLSALGIKGKVGVVTNPVVGRRYAPGVLRSLRAGLVRSRATSRPHSALSVRID